MFDDKLIISAKDNYFFCYSEGWKFMLGLAGVPSLLQLVGFYFMPESPRWLVSKGRVEVNANIIGHECRMYPLSL